MFTCQEYLLWMFIELDNYAIRCRPYYLSKKFTVPILTAVFFQYGGARMWFWLSSLVVFQWFHCVEDAMKKDKGSLYLSIYLPFLTLIIERHMQETNRAIHYLSTFIYCYLSLFLSLCLPVSSISLPFHHKLTPYGSLTSCMGLLNCLKLYVQKLL